MATLAFTFIAKGLGVASVASGSSSSKRKGSLLGPSSLEEPRVCFKTTTGTASESKTANSYSDPIRMLPTDQCCDLSYV